MKRAVFSIASQWAGMIMFLLLLPGMVLAQHQEIHEMPNLWRGRQIEEHDSTSLLAAFRDGRASGHFRSYWMNTDNRSSLSDYYALAVGGGLRYETAPFYGFQFAVSGFYIFDYFHRILQKPIRLQVRSIGTNWIV
jgi:hypothetical protein